MLRNPDEISENDDNDALHGAWFALRAQRDGLTTAPVNAIDVTSLRLEAIDVTLLRLEENDVTSIALSWMSGGLGSVAGWLRGVLIRLGCWRR